MSQSSCCNMRKDAKKQKNKKKNTAEKSFIDTISQHSVNRFVQQQDIF